MTDPRTKPHLYTLQRFVIDRTFEQGADDHWETIWEGDDALLALQHLLAQHNERFGFVQLICAHPHAEAYEVQPRESARERYSGLRGET